MCPLSVQNVSPIGTCIDFFWQTLQSVRKEEEKNEENKTKIILAARILEMAGVIFFKFGM